MNESKNMEKYEVYKSMNENLTKAMKAGFYYQAIFIEYAIIEDRCLSALKHAGVKYLDSKDRELKLSDKIKKLRSNPCFTVPYVRQRITLNFLDDVETWKRERDALIHGLAKIPYNDESVKNVAIKGQEIVKHLSNKVKSVNRYYEKLSNIDNR